MKTQQIVIKALDLINAGFDRMGRVVNNPTVLDRYLLASTYKVVRLSYSIISLCDNGFTDEAIPILRSLIEHSINMRWIMNNNTEKRLKDYMKDLGAKDFGSPWTSTNLIDRMEQIGFKNRDYYDFCVKVTYSYAHVNSSSLIWGEVYDDPRLQKTRWSSDGLYAVVTQMLGHVMKALNSRFKGYFSDYDRVWSYIKVDTDIRKKFERMRKLVENLETLPSYSKAKKIIST